MKQGKLFNRIVEVALLCVILVYFGYSILSAFRDPLTTTQAIPYEAGSGVYTTGFVVRQEQVLSSRYDITLLTQAEGAKVGRDQVLAVGYQNETAQARQSEIAQLESQLGQLKAAASYQADPSALAAMDESIVSKLQSLAIYASRRDMSGFDQVAADLKTLVLQRTADQSDLEQLQAQIAAMDSRLAGLRSQGGADTQSVLAPVSGYFSGTVDGYESVLTPDKLSSMSVGELKALAPADVSDTAFGRLVTSDTWYYVTAVPVDHLGGKIVGDRVDVSFAHDFYDSVSMRITRIGDAEDGQCILVLSCDRYLQDMTLLREQSADIIFKTYSGLRVPKEAVRMDEDRKPGVFVLESASAKWKPIYILYDNGESYIVELDKSSTSNLWPGDELIVNAKDLFDGKVVQ